MSSFDDLTRESPHLKIDITQKLNSPLPSLPIHDRDVISRGIHFTPDKIDLIARDLSECRVNAAFVTKSMTDQGRIVRYIADIQDALATRQQDILFYLERMSTPYIISPSSRNDSPTTAVQLSPLSADPSPNALSHSLFELQERVALLNDKLKTYRIRTTAFFDLGRRKGRLLELTSAIHDAWINLLIQLTLSISRASSEAATFANGNVNKLAIATGTQDWDDLSLEDARSYFMQGEKYFLGYGVPKSNDLAFKRYQTAAKLGLAEAAVMLASMYENGFGQKKDLSAAMKWYKVGADSNNMEALNHLGRMYELGIGTKKNYELAFKYYNKAAALGHLNAITSYGHLLQNGLGCSPDPEAAFMQFKLAAEKDFPKAQNYLATCYYVGKGVAVDYHQAVNWFKKAADQGFPPAMNNLGICYEEGAGVGRDILAAQMNYSLAADARHPGGMNNLGYIYMIDGHYDEALKCFNMAYSLGNIDALYNLGTIYESGRPNVQGHNCRQDLETAISYYKDGAEQGCIKSQLRLGTLLCEESHFQDLKLAQEYLLMASSARNDSEISKSHSFLIIGDSVSKFQIEAQNLLGECYELIESSDSDFLEAAKWYSKASKSGHARATFNLASLYETGKGVEKDFKKAIQLYKEAITRGSIDAQSRIDELEDLLEI